MTESQRIEVKSESGDVVAVMHVQEGLLHGSCQWFNQQGEQVSTGIFKNGTPYNGTFLNWSLYFLNIDKQNPYELKAYSTDHITLFHDSRLSERPDYNKLLETYKEGVKVSAL